MKRIVIILAVVFALTKFGWAYAMPAPHPLSEMVGDADIIVVCKIASFTADKNEALPDPDTYTITNGKRDWNYSTRLMIYLFNRVQVPGTYTFSEAMPIKGNFNKAAVALPAIQLPYVGGLQTPPRTGDEVLLLLKRDKATGQLSPAEPLIPLIPLSRHVSASRLTSALSATESDPLKMVENVLMASMDDPTFRQATTFILSGATGPNIVIGLSKYVNDPNLEVRANVLNAMLINQQVSCIPRVAVLEHLLEDRGNGTRTNAIGAFNAIQAPESVDYLNPLLWDSYSLVRNKAMQRISDLGNASSIPYLLLCTQDPDPTLKLSAISVLGHICPGVRYADEHQNVVDSDKDLRQASVWWSDELNGRHAPRLWPNPDDTILLPTSAEALDKLVWAGDNTHRERVINHLEPVATRNSVPYLLVALYDPDPIVKYKSYVILNRLLGTSNKPVRAEVFAQRPDEYTSPLFDWWKAELLGHHRPPPLAGATYVPVSPELLSAIRARIKAKDASSP